MLHNVSLWFAIAATSYFFMIYSILFLAHFGFTFRSPFLADCVQKKPQIFFPLEKLSLILTIKLIAAYLDSLFIFAKRLLKKL